MLVQFQLCNDKQRQFLYKIVRERHATPYINISNSPLPSYEEHIQYLKNHYGHDGIHDIDYYLLWEEDGQYKGCLTAKEDGEIGIFVLEEFHGQGIGTKLWKGFLEKYSWRDTYDARIHTNNHPSQDFFKSLGFKNKGYIYEWKKS